MSPKAHDWLDLLIVFGDFWRRLALIDPAARIVFGYHGCLEPLASGLLTGNVPIGGWPRSANTWDWLGEGIYFWEHAPERALAWATDKASQAGAGTVPGVVGAVILLRRCFDLTNPRFTKVLRTAHDQVKVSYEAVGKPLPKNRGSDEDRKLRELDCLVINYCLKEVAKDFDTVRCPFWEGPPIYPGTTFRTQSHIQIAVRDAACILGVFRPNLEAS
jgi:hypothetical protein